MLDYEHSETRSIWWRFIKTTPPNYNINTTSSDARLCAFGNKIYMVEVDPNHPKVIKHITSSDARLWAFRNKISVVEAIQNHPNITKHIASSDARLRAFRNKISTVKAHQNYLNIIQHTIQVMPDFVHSETRFLWWRLIKTMPG